MKQTHGKKFAENFESIIKKLKEVQNCTQKLKAVFKKPDSENEKQHQVLSVEIETFDESEKFKSNIRAVRNSSNFSHLLRETLGSLMRSRNSSRIEQNDSGQAKFLGVPIQVFGKNSLKIKQIVS